MKSFKAIAAISKKRVIGAPGISVILIGASLVLVAYLFRYLHMPLPPPKVTLSFSGFGTNGNDVCGLVRLTNEGKRLVWCRFGRELEPEWHAEIETKGGWTTNKFNPIGIKIPSGLLSTSNLVCRVQLPDGVIRWRVTSYFYHYDRHQLRYELADRLLRTDALHFVPNSIGYVVGFALSCLPEPSENLEEVVSPGSQIVRLRK